MVCGFAVPTLPLKILTIVGCPALAGADRVRAVPQAHVLQVVRDRAHLQAARCAAAPRSTPPTRDTAGTTLGGKELAVPPPPGVGQVRWITARFGPDELAVLMHLDRGTITCTIEIEGPGVGSRDAEDQEALVDRYGTLLRHVANGDGFVTRLQMLARTLPADPDAHAKDVARRGDPNSPAWIRDSYAQLLSMVSTSSEQHRTYLTACMAYTRELATEARVMCRRHRPGPRHLRHHGARADRHLRPARRRRHKGAQAAGRARARLAGALDVRPRTPDRPHRRDGRARRVAGRVRRRRAAVPARQDPRVAHG